MRFAISFSRPAAMLFPLLGMGRAHSDVVVEGDMVRARMGWAFRTEFSRSAVSSVRPAGRRWLSRGVHGWRGWWLVNGSGDGLVEISLTPHQRARVLGLPIRLRQLVISLDDPDGLIAALQ